MRYIYLIVLIQFLLFVSLLHSIEIDETEKDASLLNFEGAKLILDGEYERAYEVLEKAIDLLPEFAQAHFNMGVVCQKMGRYEEALGEFKKAEELGYIKYELYYNMATVARDLGDAEKTEEYILRAREFSPGISTNDILLEAKLMKGDVEGAMDMIERGMVSQYKIPVFVNNLVVLCQDMGEMALPYLGRLTELVVKHNKKNEFLLAIGNIYMLCGDRESAMRLYEMAGEEFPDDRAIINRASILFNDKRYNEFIDLMSAGDNYRVMGGGKGAFYIGYSHFELARYDKAREWFMRAFDEGYDRAECIYYMMLCAQEEENIDEMYDYAKMFEECADEGDERLGLVKNIISSIEKMRETGSVGVIIRGGQDE
ncbi:MAG TPA: tetratricopeptide repeat protein [Firmicutes bacterium]|nr:tetratricopeptide repeat protein [Bacillota bacterium]